MTLFRFAFNHLCKAWDFKLNVLTWFILNEVAYFRAWFRNELNRVYKHVVVWSTLQCVALRGFDFTHLSACRWFVEVTRTARGRRDARLLFLWILKLRLKRGQTVVKHSTENWGHGEEDEPTEHSVCKLACVATCKGGVKKRAAQACCAARDIIQTAPRA